MTNRRQMLVLGMVLFWSLSAIGALADENSFMAWNSSDNFYLYMVHNRDITQPPDGIPDNYLQFWSSSSVSLIHTLTGFVSRAVYDPVATNVTCSGPARMNGDTDVIFDMKFDYQFRGGLVRPCWTITLYQDLGGMRGDVVLSTRTGQVFSLDITFAPVSTTSRGVPYDWLRQFGVTNNFEVAENTDLTGKGMKLWQEYLAGTNPRDRESGFRISAFAEPAADRQGSGVTISWTSYTNWIDTPFGIERSTNLLTGWSLVDGNVARTPPLNIWIDPHPPQNLSCFYRIVATNGM